jgi:hypothetical protein
LPKPEQILILPIYSLPFSVYCLPAACLALGSNPTRIIRRRGHFSHAIALVALGPLDEGQIAKQDNFLVNRQCQNQIARPVILSLSLVIPVRQPTERNLALPVRINCAKNPAWLLGLKPKSAEERIEMTTYMRLPLHKKLQLVFIGPRDCNREKSTNPSHGNSRSIIRFAPISAIPGPPKCSSRLLSDLTCDLQPLIETKRAAKFISR